MDTKRLLLAVALSFVVLFVYQYFFMPKPQPVQQQAGQETAGSTTQKTTPGAPGQTQPGTESQSGTKNETKDIKGFYSKKKDTPETEAPKLEAVTDNIAGTEAADITIETDLFIAVFTNRGAGMKSLILKNYKDDKGNPLDLVSEKVSKSGLYPFFFSPFANDNTTYIEMNDLLFAYDGPREVLLSGSQQKEIVFRYANAEKNISVRKVFRFNNQSYIIGLANELLKEGKALDAPVVFGPDLENNISEERGMQLGLKIRAYDGVEEKDVEFANVKTISEGDANIENANAGLGGNFLWVAYERAYFAAVFQTAQRNSPIMYSVLKEKTPAVGKEKASSKLYSYVVVTNPSAVYLGPKDEELLEAVSPVFPEVDMIIEYGMLGTIAKILLKGINFVYGFVPNYGWAIIIFTIFLKILLFPLTYTSSVSMAKMQTLQPKLKAIKKKYKNLKDPEQRRKMNVETMEMYKKEKVNPAGGCLPMLLQLPILFGFFNLLRTCINVRHEPWIFWIQDLSLKDPIYVLPILMGITQLIVQHMSPSSADASQKKMMYIMPVIITFFVINLPSGLTLYWFASNLLQIGQQYFINKKVFHKKKEEEKLQKTLKRKKGVKTK